MENFRPLYHHDSRDYDTVASEAAVFARNKIENMISAGREKAMGVITDIRTRVPKDAIVKDAALQFRFNKQLLVSSSGMPEQRVHDHAFRQLLERAQIPNTFASNLKERKEKWSDDLLAHNLNTMYGYSEERHLLRSIDGELRGFLSDRFRRLDSAPLVESFAESMATIKAVPVEGQMTDTRVFIKALLPIVYEPVRNEIVAFGLQWENSDYGNGAHNLRAFLMRLWCTNFAVAEEGIRQVHIGKRLSEHIEYSENTMRLDTEATASAIKDTIAHSLGDKTVQLFLNGIKDAHEQKVDPKKAIAELKKRLTKSETDRVIEAFNSPDIENLPAGNTRWRLSNAISWIAGKTENRERALELEQEAGRMIPQLGKVA
jgi:hypothetical protein